MRNSLSKKEKDISEKEFGEWLDSLPDIEDSPDDIDWGQASVDGLNKTVLEEKKRFEQEKIRPSAHFDGKSSAIHTETTQNIIYVLDRLLQISIDRKVINESRNIDLGLYKVLNNPKVNQEIIHTGLLPIVREKNGEIYDEFTRFIKNLWMYMEYDINTSFLWAETINNPTKQINIHKNITEIRKEIFQYILNKGLISHEEYTTQLKYKVKNLTE